MQNGDRSTPPGDHARRLRVAAAGDIHARESRREAIAQEFAELTDDVDLVLLAGDLTSYGRPEEAAILAEAAAAVPAPVLAVLGNHDWHENRTDEVIQALAAGGIEVLERSWTIKCLHDVEVGVVGAKGFVGGFAGSHLPDFGEPLLRAVYAETSAEVAALDEGLRAIGNCPLRLVLLHYAPTPETLEGEPPGIFAFLGSDRLAGPLVEHQPDLVMHGHAHSGSFRGAIEDVPVFNVSVEVTGKPFWVFELTPATATASPIH
ncbi:MAG TPA: metallophosphoesterase [Solirubrobacterales bacterium]|jgi:Icc-related predicted phosphoesterase